MTRTRAVSLPEAIKDVWQQLRRDSLPCVRNRKLDETIHAREAHDDAAAGRREFDGVRQQIRDHLCQAIRIGACLTELRRKIGADLDVLPGCGRTRKIYGSGHELRKTQRPRLDSQLAGADAAEIEQVVDDF